MRAAVHSTFANPAEVLTIEERPMPEPGPGEVRVKMVMSSIHNHDLLTVSGEYGYKPELPAIAGSEAMGTIDALGEGVQGFEIGQRIAASGLRGAWAEYFIANAGSIVPLPDAIDDETAAQLISMPLSALALLDFLDVKPGQWIIQNAATGAVAKTVAMIAKVRGISVINVVRRPEAVAELSAVGIDKTVSTASEDWMDQVRAIAGDNPIVAAVDGVGGQESGDLTSLLGDGGTLVSFGVMSGKALKLAAGDLIFKQVHVKGFWLAKIMQTTSRETFGKWIGELISLVVKGDVRLQSGGVFALDDIRKAAAASAEPGRTGKILIRA